MSRQSKEPPNIDNHQHNHDLAEEEFWEPEELFGFSQKQLPYILGAIAFLIYTSTLCLWIRPEHSNVITSITSWNPLIQIDRPIYTLIGLVFSILPDKLELIAHNLFSAFLGACVVWLLAKIVALWPYDRSPESRSRCDNPLGFLTSKFSWIPPTLASLLFITSRIPWSHATAATGQMLELFLFVWICYHLALFRIYDFEDESGVNEGDRYLIRACFLYGLAAPESFSFILWLPVFLIALIWMKRWLIFDIKFLLKCFLAAVLGLCISLLILPIVLSLKNTTVFSFWTILRQQLINKKNEIVAALQSPARAAAFVLLLVTILPLVIAAMRWKRAYEEVGYAGANFIKYLRRLLYLIMGIAAGGVFVHYCPWSPAYLGMGFSWLPLYFIASIAIACFVGTAIQEIKSPIKETQQVDSEDLVAMGLNLLILLFPLIALGLIIHLFIQNLPYILNQRGIHYRQLALFMLQSIQEPQAYVMSDDETLLAGIEAAKRTSKIDSSLILINSQYILSPNYHQQMLKWYGNQWPDPYYGQEPSQYINPFSIAQHIANLTKTSAVYYLNPSFGYFFEKVYLEPSGLIYKVLPVNTNLVVDLKIDQQPIQEIENFWDSLDSYLNILISKTDLPPEILFVRVTYSRALNWWAVKLQRSGKIELAAKRFKKAIEMWPGNRFASVNMEFNEYLQKNSLPVIDLTKPIEDPRAQGLEWEPSLYLYGPVDHPRWIANEAEYYYNGGNFRQALLEYERVIELYPQIEFIQIRRLLSEAMYYLSQGNSKSALQIAELLFQKYQTNIFALEGLTGIYLSLGDTERVLSITQKQLQLNPQYEPARLNQAVAFIHLGQLEKAIEMLSQIISKPVPEKDTSAIRLRNLALLNRAIAYLKLNMLNEAAKDYQRLLDLGAHSFQVYFGLGEIAYRQKRYAEALNYYNKYLQLAPKGTEEYRLIEERITQLKQQI